MRMGAEGSARGGFLLSWCNNAPFMLRRLTRVNWNLVLQAGNVTEYHEECSLFA